MGCTLSTESPAQITKPPNDFKPLSYEGVKVGMLLLCRDTFVSKYTKEKMYKWRKSEIIEIQNTKIKIHYLGWSDNFDVWLDLNQDIGSIAPIGMLNKAECDKGKELLPHQLDAVKLFLQQGTYPQTEEELNMVTNVSVGKNLDVLDIFYKKGSSIPIKKWRKATVLTVDGSQIKITYMGWESKYDELLDIKKDANRIREFGTKSNEQTSVAALSSPNKRMSESALALPTTVASSAKRNIPLTTATQSSITLSEENGFDLTNVDPAVRTEFEADLNKEVVFIQMLANHGLHVIEIEGDGNCLFRAISHQLYLSEDYHEKLRIKCVEHMKKYRKRFECFCSVPFDQYLTDMAILGTWGDDLEIRALEEILDYIICIYSSNTSNVAIPIRKNFEEDEILHGVPTIKLSYHGNSHYNSIYDDKQPLPLDQRRSSTLLRSRMKLAEDRKTLLSNLQVH